MSISAVHATAFYKEIVQTNVVWTIKDSLGLPAPDIGSGKRSMPFWSSCSRAMKIIANVTAYEGFKAVDIELDVFYTKWLTGLEKDGLLVGINWSGKRAVGYDVEPETCRRYIDSARQVL